MTYVNIKSFNVIAACEKTIEYILSERKTRIEELILEQMQQKKEKPNRWFFFKEKQEDEYYSREEAIDELERITLFCHCSPYLRAKYLYSERLEAVKRIKDIAILSNEINITAEDFSYIKEFYNP